MHRLARALEDLKPHYDALIVGSGYGGGVAAARLARAGKRVAVLERGREFLPGEFPTRFPDLRRELQVSGRRMRVGTPAALYDVRLGADMHVLVGCGLGGGSLINAGVALWPDPRVLCDPVWPAEICSDSLLDEGRRRALRWLRPARDPHAAAHSKFQALARAAATLEREAVAAPVVVGFEDTINPAGVAQAACTRCGDCCGGCNVGAKNTVALTYLPDAVRHGAEVFTRALVRAIAKGRHGRWTIRYRGEGMPADAPEACVTADTVLLAAGTLGTTEILLRSRAEGLALSDRLGERFSANGDLIAFGYGARMPVQAVGVGHPPKLSGLVVGACVSGQVEIVDRDSVAHSLTIQEGAMPSALAPILPVLFVPNGRLAGALQSLVTGVYRGPLARLQTFFAVSHDSASGRLVLEDDRVALSWPEARAEPVYARLDAALAALAAGVGASYVKNPLAATMLGSQPATAHPLGGCSMGRNYREGVINHKGQVFTGAAASGADGVHEGLYVADGSIMPRSLGVNPLLSITALAERTLLHMARDRGFSCDDV
jgi:cholesterol oxidase